MWHNVIEAQYCTVAGEKLTLQLSLSTMSRPWIQKIRAGVKGEGMVDIKKGRMHNMLLSGQSEAII